jgi:glycosyltransferase involved in cell wall biosynthesis
MAISGCFLEWRGGKERRDGTSESRRLKFQLLQRNVELNRKDKAPPLKLTTSGAKATGFLSEMKRELPSLSVIIPTKNRPLDLEVTVRSILDQTVLPQQLIIIDQSADGKSRGRIQILFDTLTSDARVRLKLCYQTDQKITGLAMARNRAMELAEGDVWLFLDDDVRLERDFLEQLRDAYAEHPQASGISGIVTNYRRPRWFTRLWGVIFFRGPFHDERQTVYWCADRLRNAGPIRVDRLGGGLMSFRADIIRRCRFDEKLRGVSDGEDVDFCARLGPDVVLMIAPRARLEHRQSPSGRLRDHYLHRTVRSEHFLYRKNWNRGIKNPLCFVWLNVGFGLSATLGSLRHCSLDPWRAWRAGVLDARAVLIESSRVAGPNDAETQVGSGTSRGSTSEEK